MHIFDSRNIYLHLRALCVVLVYCRVLFLSSKFAKYAWYVVITFKVVITVCKIYDFLNDRKHFVKIGESVSSTTVFRARTPQGTVSGPNDFKLVINDLSFNTAYAKYVDDTRFQKVLMTTHLKLEN